MGQSSLFFISADLGHRSCVSIDWKPRSISGVVHSFDILATLSPAPPHPIQVRRSRYSKRYARTDCSWLFDTMFFCFVYTMVVMVVLTVASSWNNVGGGRCEGEGGGGC